MTGIKASRDQGIKGNHRKPVIGITADVTDQKYQIGRSYATMIAKAGGVPVILPCLIDRIPEFLSVCDALVFSGGDDPDMAQWGVPMHPKATPLHPDRQAFELALLAAVEKEQHKPVLGICLGMQLMGLQAGGMLDQHLPDHLPTAELHWDRRTHEIAGDMGTGTVHSHHRQALSDPGRLKVIATAPDGVIEAVRGEDRPFYLGVQWHPERTADERLGIDLFRKLVQAAGGSSD